MFVAKVIFLIFARTVTLQSGKWPLKREVIRFNITMTVLNHILIEVKIFHFTSIAS